MKTVVFAMYAPMRINFPNPATTETIEDIIAVGGDLNAENLIYAYSLGIFPWPHKGYPLLWFCPEKRGIIEFKDLHVGRSLQKWIRKNESRIEVKLNHNFASVIKNCRQQKRAGQKGSWINAAIEKSYTELHKLGGVLCLECYIEDELVAGIYGVLSQKYFSCESMFFKIDNGSKFAFVKLVEHLQKMGHEWMDLQMITEVSGYLGGKYISKLDFLQRIK